MKTFFTLITVAFLSLTSIAQETGAISISQDMMTSFKMNMDLSDLKVQLAEIPFEKLVSELDNDAKKQAFWTNIYVIYSQQLIAETGTCNKKCKNKKVITVANRIYSLNNILYNILLSSKSKITRIKNPFPSKWERLLRVKEVDGRVLLAIDSHESIANAVTYYEHKKMDPQLNKVATIYFTSFASYDSIKNEIYLPTWLKNFKREFGKKSGIITTLKNLNIVPSNVAEAKVIYIDKTPLVNLK